MQAQDDGFIPPSLSGQGLPPSKQLYLPPLPHLWVATTLGMAVLSAVWPTSLPAVTHRLTFCNVP